jgi:hypothetical protein
MRVVAGVSCLAVTALLFLQGPTHARIFFHRLLGRDVPWPQRTHLEVTIPNLTEVEAGPDAIDVRVARGSDVPVVVRARGIAPDDVTLHFADGTTETLSRGTGDTYRRVLRQVQADQEFYVTGGDDDDRRPLVRLFVLQPPDVSGIAVRVRPPEYTGLPESLEPSGDVEVLAGSRLTVHLTVDPADARGIARILPEDLTVALEPRPFPTPGDVASDSPATDATPGLAFDLTAERSIRYRFELTDSSGLANPDPGLYGVRVALDRSPEVRIVSPGRSDVETVAGGAIPLRVRASDDFGLTAMRLVARDVREDSEPRTTELELRPLPDAGAGDSRGALASRRLTVADLAGPEGATEGTQFSIEVTAWDNRRPEPGEGSSSPVRVRIVSADELMRRIQDRLARLRQQASQLSDLQTEKRMRVDELLEAMLSDDLLETGDSRALSGALNGQRRVRSDADAVTRELAAIVETVLYARLDEKAGALLESLDARLSAVADRAFHEESWTSLVSEYRSGTLGTAGLAGHLVDILAVALAISETHTWEAAEALERAQSAVDVRSVQRALDEASNQQALALTRIEDLLERLAEWDSFQSVLALTRDLLERQSALRQRTQRFAKEK